MKKYIYEKVTIPEASGIYFLFGEKNELLYIGKSANLKQRLYSHFKSNSPSRLKYLGVQPKKFSVIFEEEEKLDILERQMILKYSPPFNKASTLQ